MDSKENLTYHSSHLGRQNLLAEMDSVDLPVQGNIPPWLHGSLLRIGPSWFGDNPSKASLHWFDGLSMLHAFEIKRNRVLYYNKFLDTEAFLRAKNEDIFAFVGFDTNLYDDFFQHLASMLFASDESPNANVNIYKVAGNYLALTELTPPVSFDRATLGTKGNFVYTDSLPKANVFESAHPQYDLKQKCFYNYIVKFFPRTSYLVYKIFENSSERILVSEIEVDKPSYMHSFSITENYIILTEYPLKLTQNLVLSTKPFIKNYTWCKNDKTRITIINKHNPCDIRTYYTEPFFSFHHINAYEDDNATLSINVVAYEDGNIVERIGFFPEFLDPSYLLNVRINLAENKINTWRTTIGTMDFPRINPAYNGYFHRYFYAVKFDMDRHGIIKWDTKKNKVILWAEEGCFAGEPVFIQNPSRHEHEDGGVILSLVLDGNKKTSFLLVLDAQNLKELARSYLPHFVPFGLHGQFYN